MATTLAVVSLVVAVAAWLHSRQQARKLQQLTDMYWQLRYDHGELKAGLAPASPGPPPPPPSSAFVPLGSLRRSKS